MPRPSPARFAACALGATLAVAANARADDPPSAPTGVRATLYDGAGGELFWQRASDDRGVVGYEITVNGRSLGTLDATSLYDPSLRPDTAYVFTVRAVDTAGQRSVPATAALGGGGADGAGPVDTGAAPNRPRGLDATVYSDSAVELTWERPAGPRPTWRIERDGVQVTTTIGPSFFFDDLVPRRDYRFDVFAIGDAGPASSPASIEVRTGPDARVTPIDAGPELPVTADTRPEIRPGNPSITVYSSTAAELFWNPRALERPIIRRNEIRRDGVLIDTVQGEFLRSYFDDSREPGRGYTYTITAISDAGNASATVSDEGFSPDAGPTPAPSNPDALTEGVRATLARAFDLGHQLHVRRRRVERRPRRHPDHALVRRLRHRDRPGTAGLLAIRDLSVDGPGGPYAADSVEGGGADENNRLPDGSLGLTARGVGVELGEPFGARTELRTLGPFQFDEGRAGGAPTVGRLSVESDGARWSIDAFDGDPATFTFTRESDGAAIATTLPWSDAYRLAAPSPDDVDVGF